MESKFCNGCKKKINPMPFIGDKFHEFEEGTYCEKCAKIIVEKNRRSLNG